MLIALRLGMQLAGIEGDAKGERCFTLYNTTTHTFLKIADQSVWSCWEHLLEDLVEDKASQNCIDRMWDLCPVFAKKHLMIKRRNIHDIGGEGG